MVLWDEAAHRACSPRRPRRLARAPAQRLWFKATPDGSGGTASLPDGSMDVFYCVHVAAQAEATQVWVVEDASAHPLFRANPFSAATGLTFYAGAPLVTPRGVCIGTLCVMNDRSLELNQHQLDMLVALANQARAHSPPRILPAARCGAPRAAAAARVVFVGAAARGAPPPRSSPRGAALWAAGGGPPGAALREPGAAAEER